MDGQLVAIYCLCDDLLEAPHHVEDRQRQMSDAEVMTTAIVAAWHFGGNFEQARVWLKWVHYIPNRLSRSRFNRRLHAVQELLAALFVALGACFQDLTAEAVYVIDSFPVPVGDTIRIKDARIYADHAHRGYSASQRRYCYGVKRFLLATAQGQPVEAFLAPRVRLGMCRRWRCFTLPCPRAARCMPMPPSRTMTSKTGGGKPNGLRCCRCAK